MPTQVELMVSGSPVKGALSAMVSGAEVPAWLEKIFSTASGFPTNQGKTVGTNNVDTAINLSIVTTALVTGAVITGLRFWGDAAAVGVPAAAYLYDDAGNILVGGESRLIEAGWNYFLFDSPITTVSGNKYDPTIYMSTGNYGNPALGSPSDGKFSCTSPAGKYTRSAGAGAATTAGDFWFGIDLLYSYTAPIAAFRSAGTYSSFGSSAASITLAAPAGMVAGDYIVCVFLTADNRTAITPPAGMSPIIASQAFQTSLAASTTTLHIYGGYWNGSATSFQFSWTGGNSNNEGQAIAYSGVNATAMDATFTQQQAVSATVVAPSITTVTNLAVVISILGADGDFAVNPSAPAGYTRRTPSTGSNTFVISDKVQAVAGASGSTTGTATASAPNIGVTLALRPA